MRVYRGTKSWGNLLNIHHTAAPKCLYISHPVGCLCQSFLVCVSVSNCVCVNKICLLDVSSSYFAEPNIRALANCKLGKDHKFASNVNDSTAFVRLFFEYPTIFKYNKGYLSCQLTLNFYYTPGTLFVSNFGMMIRELMKSHNSNIQFLPILENCRKFRLTYCRLIPLIREHEYTSTSTRELVNTPLHCTV